MKTLIQRTILFVLALSFLLSCKKEDPAISLSISTININAAGGDQTINVQANIDYIINIDNSCKDWISVSATRAMQDSKVILHFEKNEKITERTGKVKIEYNDICKEILITQQAALPSITPSQNNYIIESKGETVILEIKSNVNFDIEMPVVSWLELNETNDNNSNKKQLIISKNEDFEGRTADIVAYNTQYNLKEIIHIQQKQMDVIFIDGDLSIDALGGTLIQNIKSNIDYSVNCNAEWIKIIQTRALSESIVEFSIEKNSEYTSRSAEVSITNGVTEKIFTILQEGAIPGSSNIDDIPIIKL